MKSWFSWLETELEKKTNHESHDFMTFLKKAVFEHFEWRGLRVEYGLLFNIKKYMFWGKKNKNLGGRVLRYGHGHTVPGGRTIISRFFFQKKKVLFVPKHDLGCKTV